MRHGRQTSYLGWTGFTYPFNLSGHPAATVPCGFTSGGLPVGLQLVGRWHAGRARAARGGGVRAASRHGLDG